jgi:WXXGXW repeat (2 copies)
MRATTKSIRLTLFRLAVVMTVFAATFIGCAAKVLVRTAPPPIPFYEQPFCPGPGYIWVPGYWAYGPNGYYWVDGMWELAPQAGFLWTPGYWGWSDGVYAWHSGYWGRHVGFYGGINYGCGYTGFGYEGGYWRDRVFYYNSAVTRVNVSVVNTTYEKPVLSKTAAVNVVSYNGGAGGTIARPTGPELAAAREPHIGPTIHQQQLHKAAAPKPVRKDNGKKNHPQKRQRTGDSNVR